MDDRVVYLCFSSWVQARQYGRDNDIPERDLILAASPSAVTNLLRVTGPIVFLRTDYEPRLETDLERWREIADIARSRNSENGHETEILNR